MKSDLEATKTSGLRWFSTAEKLEMRYWRIEDFSAGKTSNTPVLLSYGV